MMKRVIKKIMAKISINQSSYFGRNIQISGNKIIVDGKDVTPDAKEVNIVVNGDIEKLECDFCNKISVTGKVESLKTMSGDVDISGDVTGSISTMSGDVDCGNVSGSISTMSGDVKQKRS